MYIIILHRYVYCICLSNFLLYIKGIAVSQSELQNDIDKNGTVTKFSPANQKTASNEHAPIIRNASFGSKNDSPPVTPCGYVKPRTVWPKMILVLLYLVYVIGFTKTVLNCTFGNSINTDLKY